LEQEHSKITQEYEDRLHELDRERQTLDEDKAQVDRYKQLLVKQRDIMIALTLRLHERDDTICGLQEELDAYDQHQQLMEDGVDQKAALILSLQKILSGHTNKQVFGGDENLQSESCPPVYNVTHDGDDLGALEIEYKEVEAEKVSLEYLLQEKLEKMVQVEIEERVNLYRQRHVNGDLPDEQKLDDPLGELLEIQPEFRGELDQMRMKYKKDEERYVALLRDKERQLAALEAEQSTLHQRGTPNNGPGGPTRNLWNEDMLSQALHTAEQSRARLKQEYEEELADFFREKRSGESKCRAERQGQLAEMMALKQQCATNEKERVALKTILEVKIKGLVDNTARSAMEKKNMQSAPLILREVQALQKLVNAILSVYHH